MRDFDDVEREKWLRDRAESARVADVRDGAAAADYGGDGAPEVDADGSRRAPYVRPDEDEWQNRALNVVAEYCCDMHNRNCEPPSELCCWECTEIEHPRHQTTDCIAPDLSAGVEVPTDG